MLGLFFRRRPTRLPPEALSLGGDTGKSAPSQQLETRMSDALLDRESESEPEITEALVAAHG